MKPDVVVVGSYVQDLTWDCAAFPRPGETVIGTFRTGPGGKGSNQAVAAGRAGARTLFIGAVGCDAFAGEAKRYYEDNGIAARWVEKRNRATGTAAILVSESGQNEIIVALGANAVLACADLDRKAIAGAKLLVVQLESNLATTAAALGLAQKAGVKTLLNPAPMRRDFDVRMLRHVDILVPNETEFAALVNRLRVDGRTDFSETELTALTPAEIHRLCRGLGVETVIVTLGHRGCLVSQPGAVAMVPAHRVEVVDTTGAGDAFVGGFAVGWVRSGGDVAAAAAHGNAVAALSVTKPGTAPSMPWAREVAAFLKPTASGQPSSDAKRPRSSRKTRGSRKNGDARTRGVAK
jgi:ribokinase